MALASAPTTPERSVQAPIVRRAFTAPIKSSKRPVQTGEGPSGDGETLFAHEAAKIVSFSVASPSSRFSVQSGDVAEEGAGSLPWASHTERTVAAGMSPAFPPRHIWLIHAIGPLRIYRVLGSVAFLTSGNIVQPMLAKSQCWCVDGAAKFVLRIRTSTYYRIEFSFATQDEKDQVERLKRVLDDVLQYERTPCPFQRGFTVKLPDPPQTPVKMVPWRPKRDHETPLSDPSPTIETQEYAISESPCSSRPQIVNEEDAKIEEVQAQHSPPKKVADFPPENSNHEVVGLSSGFIREMQNDEHVTDLDQSVPKLALRRTRRAMAERTVTAPPCLSKPQEPPVNSLAPPRTRPYSKQETQSYTSSDESFYSAGSPTSSQSASPPHSTRNLRACQQRRDGQKHAQHSAEVAPARLWDLTDATSAVPAVTVSGEFTLNSGICSPGLRVRRSLQKRRTQSPLPSSSNLHPPYSPPTSLSRQRFPEVLIQRTCSFLLGPPLHLLALMIKVAVKITRGAVYGSVSGISDSGERIPCSWDFSSDGSGSGSGSGSSGSDDSDEDDFGVRLGKTVSGKTVQREDSGGSWEID